MIAFPWQIRRVGWALMAILVGCEAPALPEPTSPAPSAANQADRGTNDQLDAVLHPPLPDPGDVAPVTNDPRPVDAKDPVKGRRSRAAGGYLGAVGAARFRAQHELIFQSIKHALNLYNAEHGRYPSSHEEFMEKIVRFNNIVLPELIEGEEYIYVPEEGDQGLQVRKTPSASESNENQPFDEASSNAEPAGDQPTEGDAGQ